MWPAAYSGLGVFELFLGFNKSLLDLILHDVIGNLYAFLIEIGAHFANDVIKTGLFKVGHHNFLGVGIGFGAL